MIGHPYLKYIGKFKMCDKLNECVCVFFSSFEADGKHDFYENFTPETFFIFIFRNIFFFADLLIS